MWQELLTCMGQRRVALCIPIGGEPVELVYWYGVLAAVGIFVGAWYASKHVEWEGEDPNKVWDALLWVLIPALLGGRLWYVAAEVLGGSTRYSLSRPLDIINPRLGGMNIFGAAIFGLIALIVYVKTSRARGWLMADAALMGLLIGQGIGRFGNFINIEIYGPPTGSDWFGMLVPAENRLAQFASLPPETRFHPSMLYEAFWLFLVFGALYYLFRRFQPRYIHGSLTGAYLVLTGLGRFIMEVAGLRPDQPLLPNSDLAISFSAILAMVYVVVGLVIALDRYNLLRIPFIGRPQTLKQREAEYSSLQRARERAAREREREKMRAERRKARYAGAAAPPQPEQGTSAPAEDQD